MPNQTEENKLAIEDLDRRLEEQSKKLEELEKPFEFEPPDQFEDIPHYPKLKVDKLYGGLPIFTAVPTYLGLDGEFVWVDDGTNYMMYVYLDSAWRKLGTDESSGLTSRARAYLGSNQAVNDSTLTKILLDTESFDGDGEFASYKFVAASAGYYAIVGQVYYEVTTIDTHIVAHLYKNGAVMTETGLKTSNDTAFMMVNVQDIVYLAANDYIELWTWHNMGAGKSVYSGSKNTFLAIHRLS